MEANKIEIRNLLLSFATVAAIELTTSFLVAQGLFHPMLIQGGARLLEIVTIFSIFVTWGDGLSSLGLARSELVSGFKKGLIWSAAFGIVIFVAFAALFLAGANPLKLLHTRLPTQPRDLALFFLIGGLVGPAAEEIFFRGVLYGFFRRWGVAVALILSTLIFVMSHAITHGIPFTQLVGGILFAVAYEVEGLLVVPITIHCLGNMAIFALSLLSY